MSIERIVRSTIVWTLLATALTPLVVVDSWYFFPFVFPKAIFYRVLVELSLIGAFVYLAIRAIGKKDDRIVANGWSVEGVSVSGALKSPLFLAIAIFTLSAVFSTLLAPNVYRGFFGDLQRGEGLLGFLHYLAFLLLALAFFARRDWMRFFWITLGVGFVSVLYAWFQYYDVPVFFGLDFARQPGSFSGNPSFLASYLILALAPAALVCARAQKAFVKYGAGLLALIFVSGIFLTAVRGAIVGFAAGLLAAALILIGSAERRRIRAAAAAIFAFVILFAGAFWLTRESPLWLRIPGMGRLATATLENPSVVTRLIGLRVSVDAWKERPILGWGMENYSVAYNKHYDPSYSFFAEDWFDRAHNRFADVLVTQGAVGILSYFAILGSIFLVLWRRLSRGAVLESAAIGGVVVAYIVQNLFLFDQVTSYIPFFALAGFLIYEEERRTSAVQRAQSGPMGRVGRFARLPAPVILACAAAASLGLAYMIYAWNGRLIYQAVAFRDAMKLRVGEKILQASDSFLKPYNFLQMELRGKFAEILYNSNLLRNKQFDPLVNKGLDALEEATKREPWDPRNWARLIEAYNERAKDDPALYVRTEEYARKAVALSPTRQGLRYHLAFTLAGQDRYEEAIALSRETLALEARLAKSHYELAVNLALAADSAKFRGTPQGDSYREEAAAEMNNAREFARTKLGSGEPYPGNDPSATQYYLFLESDLKNMVVLYRTWGEYEEMADVLEVLTSFHPQKKDYHYDAVIIYRLLRNADGVIRHAEAIKKIDPSAVNDMDIVIDLARQGKWSVLDEL